MIIYSNDEVFNNCNSCKLPETFENILSTTQNMIDTGMMTSDNTNNILSKPSTMPITGMLSNINYSYSTEPVSNMMSNINNITDNGGMKPHNAQTTVPGSGNSSRKPHSANGTVPGSGNSGRKPHSTNGAFTSTGINNDNTTNNTSNTGNTSNTSNTNDTNKSFNKFIDNQSKENEKIITNYITTNSDTDYMNNYITYQKNGMELSDTETALKENIWRASIGNQDVVQPFLKNAKIYYDNIFKRGVNNSPPNEMLKNYLESAEYNYIVPLNEGMVNPEYTFVAPSNWNYLNFTPPVCVIDKARKNTVVPTITRSDQMPFASMEEFDRAARFTGNMQINTEFIKNYMNNPMV